VCGALATAACGAGCARSSEEGRQGAYGHGLASLQGGLFASQLPVRPELAVGQPMRFDSFESNR
jgi:hypothetical protein